MATSGYIWVEGTELHYIDGDGDERAEEGSLEAGSGTAGYIWIEGDRIHYIDASGNERYLPFEAVGTDPSVAGYIWVEGDWIHYSAEGDADEKMWHTDSHTDIAHTDVPWDETYVDHSQHYNNPEIGHNDHLQWYDHLQIPNPYTDHEVYDDNSHVDHTVWYEEGYDVAHDDTAHTDDTVNKPEVV